MFDAEFYKTVLPARVQGECQAQPEKVAVVNFHLGDGRILDLCDIEHLGETWFSCRYFRDAESCEDMDSAFIPYGFVSTVSISLHHPTDRRVGFIVAQTALSDGPAGSEAKHADPV